MPARGADLDRGVGVPASGYMHGQQGQDVSEDEDSEQDHSNSFELENPKGGADWNGVLGQRGWSQQGSAGPSGGATRQQQETRGRSAATAGGSASA